MIQDIEPYELCLDYDVAPAQSHDLVFAFDGRAFLTRFDGSELRLPCAQDFSDSQRIKLQYLFSISGKRVYAWLGPEGVQLDGFCYEPNALFRSAEPLWLSFAGITAFQLQLWYRDRSFCGRCASPMQPDTHERAMRCPSCNHVEYPRICPAVIIGVCHKNRILMSKYAGRTYKHVALIAGFVEIGETPEDTVRREVWEEVGLKVSNIRYAGSQPWGMDSDLLLGYWCDLDGSDAIHLDQQELAAARWVHRSDIEAVPNRRTLTFDMIERFRLGEEHA